MPVKRRIFLSSLLTIAFAGSGSTQAFNQPIFYLQDVPTYSRQARLIDHYDDIRFNDEKARLDILAIELQRDPSATGYIIAYGGSPCKAGQAKARANRAKRYLVFSRLITPERIITVDGEYRNVQSAELYLVPIGAVPPTPSPTFVRCIRPRPGGKSRQRRQPRGPL
jgi:hypothetical protein